MVGGKERIGSLWLEGFKISGTAAGEYSWSMRRGRDLVFTGIRQNLF